LKVDMAVQGLAGAVTMEGATRSEPGAATPALLALSGVSHAFGARKVLDDVAFEVRRGELFGLLGPNGSGKSTILRVLTGLLEPDQARVELSGRPVPPGGRALRERLGVVFQAPSLDARLGADENLALSGALYGLGGAELRERVQQALDFAQLGERAHERVADFSGGMRRRLELARALLHGPELLLMDEPTSGLDETSFRRTWERIEELRAQRGLTVVFTTHRPEEAALCDRVVVIDQGRVVAIDTPEALRRRVSGDILTLEADEPEALCALIAERFELAATVVDGKVVLERERGHELIPRLVEGLPAGRIRSLSMHRPTLADVFVKLTGHSLRQEASE
jgi:ABC-2 type transport system ATP-binding protein